MRGRIRKEQDRPGPCRYNPAPMRTILTVLLLASTTLAEDVPLRREVLGPGERLDLPRLRVEVGPEKPWTVRGRSRPVAFEAADGILRVDADLVEGFEAAVAEGASVAVALDGGGILTATFVSGAPAAGEPPWSVVVCDVLAGRIGRHAVRFVDHDADGTFLTPNRDFLVGGREGEIFPVAPAVIIDGGVYRLRSDEPGARISVEADPAFADREVFPAWPDVADGLRHLNDLRAGMNLPPVALDREASRHAMLHLRYCERVGGNTHIEEEGHPAYTREGAAAGINSVGWIGGGSVASAVDGHLGSLLHRMDLIDPRKTAIGIAAGGGRVWIHTECGEYRPWNDQGPVIFPGPRRRWITGAYTGDNPDPRPEPVGAGLPVTVSWFGEDDGIRDVEASLLSARGPVPCWVNDSKRRELATNHSSLRAVLLPKQTLAAGRLVLKFTRHGQPCRIEHGFSIGRR